MKEKWKIEGEGEGGRDGLSKNVNMIHVGLYIDSVNGMGSVEQTLVRAGTVLPIKLQSKNNFGYY